jgi:hypothetical protein
MCQILHAGRNLARVVPLEQTPLVLRKVRYGENLLDMLALVFG